MFGDKLEFSDKNLFEMSQNSVDLMNISLPFIIKNHIVFSPGTHNGSFYSKEAIKLAYQRTDWNNPKVGYIYYEHRDEFGTNPRTGAKDIVVGADARDWLGTAVNMRYDDRTGDMIADLHFVDMDAARKIAYGVNFGISPRGRGDMAKNVVRSFVVDNFALVVNPAIKSTYFNSETKDINYGYFISLSEIDNGEKKMSDETEKELKEGLKTMQAEVTALKEEKTKKEEKEKAEKMAEEAAAKKAEEDKAKESAKADPKKDATTEKDVKDKPVVDKDKKDGKEKELEDKNKQLNEDSTLLKDKIKELEKKLVTPKESATHVTSKVTEEMNEEDVDSGFVKVLKSMKGYDV